MISLWFFSHLKFFKAGCNIFFEILVISFIVFSEVEPSNESSFKIKQVIIMLVLHLFCHRVKVLYTLCSTWLLRLRLLFKSSQNVIPGTFESHIKTFLFLLFNDRKLFNRLNTNDKRSWSLNLTFVMEEFFITESAIFSLGNYRS